MLNYYFTDKKLKYILLGCRQQHMENVYEIIFNSNGICNISYYKIDSEIPHRLKAEMGLENKYRK